MNGMIKLITSDSYDSLEGSAATMIEDSRQLTKQASTIFGRDYSDLKPDKDHVGIHLVALGDFERYGSNRNGDSFPKSACVKYHPTFVKHAHVFRGHDNKDPKNALGHVKASAYNEPMGRIELFVHVSKDKAPKELGRFEKEGTLPFSMACKVAHDRCNICNTLRKSASDPNQCSHIRDHLGEVFEDGKVACTHNDEPDFFDISIVGKPADRIAWDLKKVASAGIVSGIELAEQAGICMPGDIAVACPMKQAMWRQLVANEEIQLSLDKKASLMPGERYMRELRKAAKTEPSDAVIDGLRAFDHRVALHAMAKQGVLLTPSAFFKFAMGMDYGDLAEHMPAILDRVASGLYSGLSKSGRAATVSNGNYFDVDPLTHVGYITDTIKASSYVRANLYDQASLLGGSVARRVIDNTLMGCDARLREKQASEIGSVADAAAEVYAAYKVSALKGIMDYNPDADRDALLAAAAVHGM